MKLARDWRSASYRLGRLSAVAVGVCATPAHAAAQDSPPPQPFQPSGSDGDPVQPDVGERPIIRIVPPPSDFVGAKILRRPTQAEVDDAFPSKALQAGKSGKGKVVCEIARSTLLENCRIVSEDPPGLGFGDAGLKLAGLFRVQPAAYLGEAIDGGKFEIPFTFRIKKPPPAPKGTSGQSEQERSLERRAAVVSLQTADGPIAMTRTPSEEEVAQIFPARALHDGVSGRAVMTCTISAKGMLGACEVEEERPKGYGFGEAAIYSALHFRVTPPMRNGSPRDDARVTIPLEFNVRARGGPGFLTIERFYEAPPKHTEPPEVDRSEEVPAQRIARLGPLVRSNDVLWAPWAFAAATIAGLGWSLLPVRRNRRPRRAA